MLVGASGCSGTAVRSCTCSGWSSEQRQRGGEGNWGGVYVFSSGCGCCQGTGIGELRILVVVVFGCVLVWGNTKFSHSSPFLLCFNVLQCVLLLGLAHLPQHLPPLCSAARSPAGRPLSLLSHPPSSSSATPTSARPSAAEGLPRPCTRLLTGARDFGC